MPSKSEFKAELDAAWEETLPGQSSVPLSEVKTMLQQVGLVLPNYKVREILENLKRDNKTDGDKLSRSAFEELCETLQADDVSNKFRTTRDADADAEVIEGQFGYRLILDEEERAFADWINYALADDADVAHKLKITPDDMYEKMDDGVMLCKMINLAVPDTVDERAINKGKNIIIFKQQENLSLAINSAKAIGCVVVGVDAHNIHSKKGKKYLLLGMIWQLIKMYLYKQITITRVPGLANLLQPGEDINELLKLSEEEILMKWANYQLEKAGCSRRMTNFKDDIKDSEIYTELIAQIAPKDAGVNKLPLTKTDPLERAEMMLQQAEKIDSRAFVTPQSVVNGNEKLNMAFVANLFNKHPALEPPEEEIFIEETREEKTYRNWMNSLGVTPRVNYMYSDLYNGLIIFQLMDFVKPGIVDWKKRVNTKEKLAKERIAAKKVPLVLENCNYAVELGRKLNLVLVGIGGSDIMEGNKMLTLALVWQLMKAYTLSLLSRLNPDGTPIVESEILAWANNRLKEEGTEEVEIKSFQDKTLRTAIPILRLVDAIKPGAVNWSIVIRGENLSQEECFENAKYCVGVARKIGAPVYALPEDISEVKHKMVMTVFASLMLADMN